MKLFTIIIFVIILLILYFAIKAIEMKKYYSNRKKDFQICGQRTCVQTQIFMYKE